MTNDRLDYYLMLAATAEPDTQGALRDAVIELVAAVRRLQGQTDTDPAPAPVDRPTAPQPVVGTFSPLAWGDDDDGEPA